jgi:hypothetical protein
VDDAALERLFAEGDRRLPFVGDLLNYACTGRDPLDVLVLTNADTLVASDACVRIAAALQANDAGYAFRRDAHYKLAAVPRDEDFETFVDYAGADLFFMRVGWWREHRKSYPQLVLAREAWDCVLRVLIEATNPHKPLALPNLIAHERHGDDVYWENPKLRYRLGGQVNNLRLAHEWLLARKIQPGQFGIRRP